MNAPSKLPRSLNEDLDPDMPANRVVIAFGGARRMSDLTKFPISTIYAWQKNGLIPNKWRLCAETQETESYPRYLQRVAKANDVDLPDSIFLEDAAE